MSSKKVLKVIFQGDSVTDTDRDRNVAGPNDMRGLGNGYPLFAAMKLRKEFAEKDVEFYNRGVSGNRVVDLYARWKVDCLNMKPDVLSILIGINDTWHEYQNHNGVELPRYEQVYRMMLEWTRQTLPNVKLVLMEPFFLPFACGLPVWKKEVSARGKIVAKLAKEFSAVFIPTQTIVNDAAKRAPGEYWLADGVHPRTEGHQLIADAWVKYASPLFK